MPNKDLRDARCPDAVARIGVVHELSRLQYGSCSGTVRIEFNEPVEG
jgi:hypothetical protein